MSAPHIPPQRGVVASKGETRRTRAKLAAAVAEQTPPPKPDPADRGWHNTPSVLTQFTDPRFRPYCRVLPPEMHYFSIPSELEEFNKLQSSFYPEGAPERLHKSTSSNFLEKDGSYRLLVLTQRVQYRKLLDLPTPPTESPKEQ